MRIAIFVAVVLAHVVLFLLWPAWRRAGPQEQQREDSPFVTPLVVVPLTSEPAAEKVWQAPLLYRRARKETPAFQSGAGLRSRAETPASAAQTPAEAAIQPSAAEAPDWHGQAESVAAEDARRIVEAENSADRKANALTAHFKPLPPPRLRGPGFGWDYARTHRIAPLPGGFGLAIAINDNCQILIFPMPFIGCAIGKQPANGDLFLNLHAPVKYGDWDWRVHDR